VEAGRTAIGCILKVETITMSNNSRIAKWGNSLAVRIPLAIAKQASLTEGDPVELALDRKGGIVLRPARRRYVLSDLVAQVTPKNRHRETDWGRRQGKESW
jgi:antitoxin MazE